MRITIVGAGAIGGLAGAWMAMAGEDVTLVDRWKEHVQAIREHGLVIDGLRGDHLVRLPACTPEELAGPLEMVFLACKSQDTRAAITTIAPLLTPDSAVVSLQNGMNEEVIGDVIGIDRVIGAIPDYGGALVDPGHLEFVHPGPAYVGELDGRITDRVREAHRLLSHLTDTELTTNIVGRVWAKQIHGTQVVMTGLVEAPIVQVLRDERHRHLAVSLVAEATAVAAAAGVTLPEGMTVQPERYRSPTPEGTRALIDDLGQWVEATLHHQEEAEAAGTHRYVKQGSGIWWDLYYRHRPSETRWITGELVRRADDLGVPVPLNRRTAEMIYEIEAGSRAPEFANLDELYAYGRDAGALLPL